MEQAICNIAGKPRLGEMGGREYLIVPLSMLVPGVLNGSRGALLYTKQLIQRYPDSWNGMPIVIEHPKNQDGVYISGRTPEVLANSIGFVFNTFAVDKLGGEGWFDVEKTKRADLLLYQRLQRGERIELSTGLIAKYNKPSQANAVFNGKPYDYEVVDYRPDHLAILPYSKGACSLDDGCGVSVNQEHRRSVWNKLGEALGITSGNANQAPDDTANNNSNSEEQTPMSKNVENCGCPTLVGDLIKNEHTSFTEDDRQWLSTLENDKLKKLAPAQPTNNQDDAEEMDITKLTDEQLTAEAAKRNLNIANNTDGDQTVNKQADSKKSNDQPQGITISAEQWEEVANALKVTKMLADREQHREEAQKAELIERLTANLEGEAKQQRVATLSKKSVDDLQDFVDLVPPKPNRFGNVNYGVAAVANNASSSPKLKPMPVITANWEAKTDDEFIKVSDSSSN